jgi:signal transduction histidine kinase
MNPFGGAILNPAFKFLQMEHYERRRLSQRLHDDLQQLIVVSKMLLQKKSQDPAAPKEIHEVIAILDSALSVSRSFAVELSPPLLYKSGIKSSMEWLVKWIFDQHGIGVELRFTGSDYPVPEAIGHFLVWSFKELFLSIPASERATQAILEPQFLPGGDFQASVRTENAQAWLTLSPELMGIRDRIEMLGGSFKVDTPADGKGKETVMSLPAEILQPVPKAL